MHQLEKQCVTARYDSYATVIRTRSLTNVLCYLLIRVFTFKLQPASSSTLQQ